MGVKKKSYLVWKGAESQGRNECSAKMPMLYHKMRIYDRQNTTLKERLNHLSILKWLFPIMFVCTWIPILHGPFWFCAWMCFFQHIPHYPFLYLLKFPFIISPFHETSIKLSGKNAKAQIQWIILKTFLNTCNQEEFCARTSQWTLVLLKRVDWCLFGVAGRLVCLCINNLSW